MSMKDGTGNLLHGAHSAVFPTAGPLTVRGRRAARANAELPREDRAPTATPVAALAESGRSRVGTLMGVQILATGSYAPEPVVHERDLAQYGFDADWIVQRTGIHERRHAPPGHGHQRRGLRGRRPLPGRRRGVAGAMWT